MCQYWSILMIRRLFARQLNIIGNCLPYTIIVKFRPFGWLERRAAFFSHFLLNFLVYLVDLVELKCFMIVIAVVQFDIECDVMNFIICCQHLLIYAQLTESHFRLASHLAIYAQLRTENSVMAYTRHIAICRWIINHSSLMTNICTREFDK